MPDSVKKNLVRVSLILAIIGFAGVRLQSELRTGLVGLSVQRPELLIAALGAAWLWLLLQYWTGIKEPSRNICKRLRDKAITYKLREKPRIDPEYVRTVKTQEPGQVSPEDVFVKATCNRVGAADKMIRYRLEFSFRAPDSKGDITVLLGIHEFPRTENLWRQIRTLTFAVFTDVDAGETWGPLVIATIPIFVWLPKILPRLIDYLRPMSSQVN